ncbi:MAG: hypothetical protein FWG10_13615 [Eubacteriaceae bacterium]|nr:hypothetical protein [Eubacteriaceae bacterium]
MERGDREKDSLIKTGQLYGQESDAKLFRLALALASAGLALASFNMHVSIFEAAAYSRWAGSLLIAASLWMLHRENSLLNLGFIAGLFSLAVQSAEFWLGAMPPNRLYSLAAPLAAMSLLFANICFLLMGLGDIASKFGEPKLANRLWGSFVLYTSSFVLQGFCFDIPGFAIPIFVYSVFVFAALPLTVNELNRSMRLGRPVAKTSRLNAKSAIAALAYAGVTAIIGFALLRQVNQPNPLPILDTGVASSEAIAIATREAMRDLGMPEKVLGDLPDWEIALYEGIYDASISVGRLDVASGGGQVEITGFVGAMPDGWVRTLFYYRWLEAPKAAYVDLLSVTTTTNPIEINISRQMSSTQGAAYYEKDGVTYRQTLLNDGKLVQAVPISYPLLKFYSAQVVYRVYPEGYENQRGFVAASTNIKSNKSPINVNSYLTYAHQENLWNRPYFDAAGIAASNAYNSLRNIRGSNVYIAGEFYTHLEYWPGKQ